MLTTSHARPVDWDPAALRSPMDAPALQRNSPGGASWASLPPCSTSGAPFSPLPLADGYSSCDSTALAGKSTGSFGDAPGALQGLAATRSIVSLGRGDWTVRASSALESDSDSECGCSDAGGCHSKRCGTHTAPCGSTGPCGASSVGSLACECDDALSVASVCGYFEGRRERWETGWGDMAVVVEQIMAMRRSEVPGVAMPADAPPAVDPVADEVAQACGWALMWDPVLSRAVFFNVVTRTVQWHQPFEVRHRAVQCVLRRRVSHGGAPASVCRHRLPGTSIATARPPRLSGSSLAPQRCTRFPHPAREHHLHNLRGWMSSCLATVSCSEAAAPAKSG